MLLVLRTLSHSMTFVMVTGSVIVRRCRDKEREVLLQVSICKELNARITKAAPDHIFSFTLHILSTITLRKGEQFYSTSLFTI